MNLCLVSHFAVVRHATTTHLLGVEVEEYAEGERHRDEERREGHDPVGHQTRDRQQQRQAGSRVDDGDRRVVGVLEDGATDARAEEHGREEFATDEAEAERRARCEDLEEADADQSPLRQCARVGALEEDPDELGALTHAERLKDVKEADDHAADRGKGTLAEREHLILAQHRGPRARPPPIQRRAVDRARELDARSDEDGIGDLGSE